MSLRYYNPNRIDAQSTWTSDFLDTYPITWKITAIFVASGILLKLNNMLNIRALNHHCTAKQWNWHKEIVLITGGSSGIGELVVRKLAKQSIKVVVLDIQAPWTLLPSGVWFYKADVTRPESIARVAKLVRAEVGEPTVLINNAGIGSPQDFITKPLDQIRKVFKVNALSHFTLVQEFVPDMIKNDHGHILTVSSMAAYVTIAGGCDYSCSKAASMAFNEGLRQDLRHIHQIENVCTSVIHPGFVKTPMMDVVAHNLRDTIMEADPVAEKIMQQVLGGKSGCVTIPSNKRVLAFVRGFPDWVQEWIRGSMSDTWPGPAKC